VRTALTSQGEIAGMVSRSTPVQRWTLGLASVASFVVVLDLLVVATALTAIRLDLGASVGQLEWIVNAYTLSFAVLLMTSAALGDRFGRRRGLAVGLALFGPASAASSITGLAALLDMGADRRVVRIAPSQGRLLRGGRAHPRSRRSDPKAGRVGEAQARSDELRLRSLTRVCVVGPLRRLSA
jgi:MFS transporter